VPYSVLPHLDRIAKFSILCQWPEQQHACYELASARMATPASVGWASQANFKPRFILWWRVMSCINRHQEARTGAAVERGSCSHGQHWRPAWWWLSTASAC